MHIAQMNIGRVLYPLDDPRLADFVGALAAINEMAERTPGFVWRLKDDTGEGATGLPVTEHPRDIVNMSVWESAEALEHFTWRTAHARIYNRKGAWFEPHTQPSFVMWPVQAGYIPTLAEGLERLAHLRAHGASEHAFGWEALPHLKLWMSRRCG
jgi:hypothetical protein